MIQVCRSQATLAHLLRWRWRRERDANTAREIEVVYAIRGCAWILSESRGGGEKDDGNTEGIDFHAGNVCERLSVLIGAGAVRFRREDSGRVSGYAC